MGQFIKKKLDSRVRTLIENGVQQSHRSFFVIIGDHGKDQVVYLHYMLSKARVAVKPSVLWCYKKELGFSSHRKKRMRQHTSMVKKGLKDADSEDPFELFIAGTDIRYCYYKESEKVLGNTYGMCVLQDFEALTPNLLARTVETVQGGGIVVLLLRSLKSLKQLYTMNMDVHSRYRTESHNDVVGRFNERFILSLGNCENCLVVDDELNILPISLGKSVKPIPLKSEEERAAELVTDLVQLKESLKDTEPVNSLVSGAKTIDQAKAILTFIEAISEKTLKSTVSLTAARGRGKSAALGVALASAVAYGYSNIFVTSPSPENLKTLFEFVFKTFDALGYSEHLDYDLVQSTNPDFNKAVVRVNIFRNHRQTIQYIQPQDAHVLGQAELVVIDEAAAIPLPLVKKLIGNYLVFMASTINGYEGTGRSLSLKLLQQLREQSRGLGDVAQNSSAAASGRVLREIKLEEPIRYAANDPTEKWLNKVLCLDAASAPSRLMSGCPHPSECQLYNVNRDTLFSFHPVSEAFLQRMMGLYVASHYKNSPNDLQLMSDAPAHQLFVLLPPIKEDCAVLPEPLVVIQLCLEGEISKGTILSSLQRGKRADGDLIPWTISQQYQDDDFAGLSGARVVRIATHPDYSKMGYGSRALDLLIKFYEGKIACVNELDALPLEEQAVKTIGDDELLSGGDVLHEETLHVRDPNSMPPLLLSLEEMKPPALHWLGVSYGMTNDLLRFWKKSGLVPVYLRQTPNDLTGEHTCIMLRTLDVAVHHYDPAWLYSFSADFKKRFLNLLGFQFREFATTLALNVIDVKVPVAARTSPRPLDKPELDIQFSPYDLKRLVSYTNNMLDYHVIMDMLPQLARHAFLDRLVVDSGVAVANENAKSVALSSVQKAILLGMGLQFKDIETIAGELGLPVSQLLGLFARTMKKICDYYMHIKAGAIEADMLQEKQKHGDVDVDVVGAADNKESRDVMDEDAWLPNEQTLDEDLDEASREKMLEYKKKQREIIDGMDMSKYEIGGDEEDWKKTLKKAKLGSGGASTVVSVKNTDPSKHKKRKSASITVQELAASSELKQQSVSKKSKKSPKSKN